MATQPTYIYGDTVTAVLNTARARVGDLLITPAGSPTAEVGGATLLKQLEDDGVTVVKWTQVYFNNAWRKCQQDLLNMGWRGMIDTIVISSIPKSDNADLGVQNWISWNGCFDGSTFRATPALPQVFISPILIRERVHGGPSRFEDMVTALYGLRNVPGRSRLNRQWEWRRNGLYYLGATEVTDLEIRCRSYFPDFVATTNPTIEWYDQLVPIPRVLSALAWYVAIEVIYPRGDEPGFATALQQAQSELKLVFGDQAVADDRTPLAQPETPEVVVQ